MTKQTVSPKRPEASLLSGFTLIELLAVVAIVLVLSALIMPMVNNLLERAKVAGCLNNLRQLGTVMQSYASEHSGTLPPDTGSGWEYYLDDYVSPTFKQWGTTPGRTMKAIWVCPAEKPPLTGSTYYGLNGEFRGTTPITLASMVNPSHYVLLSDTSGSRSITTSHTTSMVSCGLTHRHNGHPNFLYGDGHAAAFMGELLGYSDSTDPSVQMMWFASYRRP